MFRGLGGTVGEEMVDEVAFAEHLTSLWFSGAYKDDIGDDDAFHFATMTTGIDTCRGLTGNVGFVPEFLKFVAADALIAWLDNGYKPFGVALCYGFAASIPH